MQAEWPLIRKTWRAQTYQRFLLNYDLSSDLFLWFAITLSKSSLIISCISSMRAPWKIAHCYFWFQETNCISKYTASIIQPGCGFINPESFPGILSQSQRQLVENPRGMGIHSFDFMNCSTGSRLNVKRRNKMWFFLCLPKEMAQRMCFQEEFKVWVCPMSLEIHSYFGSMQEPEWRSSQSRVLWRQDKNTFPAPKHAHKLQPQIFP